ncbi:SWI/SNF and RSC complexes subunit [Escovopsis weberi]|uniref:SWI/SNF and RSC complexes subunit n=1 Tax=Escovopsis weberi TaxID=150374 RepID=A0A0M8N529_ESCWE|nr:SWI/SNF and RSC complexes subunit [Escovopsis weberi]
MAQPDPSHSVPQDLMPHVHLISSFRYPAIPRLDLNEVAKWLMNAPQIARDRAPFFWTYLDKPTDGTILLTWQPLQRLGINFATDGFIWAPPEQIYKHDLGNGLMLEIYYLKAGYIPGEQFALHARRRFRLVPVVGHPNPPQPDPNLFIVHYGPAEPNDRIPVTMIPYDERVNAIMQQRHFLQRAGQIRRKEFMLSDRVNWPSLPDLSRQQMGPQVAPRGVPQQMAYPSQPPPGPPAKRPRHAQNQAQQGTPPGMPALDAAFDDDEDISRGDMFDHLTPRELSLSRYQQNHEWMEEILSSAYRINQIMPADLGLGLKGELAPLTEGIFTAQGGEASIQAPEKAYVGRLDPGQADEFRKRVENYIASAKTEMKQMEEEHLKTIAMLRESSVFKTKERELRSVPVDGSGPEIWRVDRQNLSPSDGKDEGLGPRPTLESIQQQVEAATGAKIIRAPASRRIIDGGYQPPVPEPVAAPDTNLSRQPSESGSHTSGLMLGDNDMDMGGTAAGLLDQMHTGRSNSTPVNNFPTPQAQSSTVQSGAGTPSLVANTTAPAAPVPAAATQPAGGDVQMGGTDNQGSRTTPDQGTGSGDWVVVPKNETPAAVPPPRPAAPAPAATTAAEAVPATTQTAPGTTEGDSSKSAAPAATKPPSTAATPAVTEGGSVSFDQNDFSSLGDLDTAGEALAEYEESELGGGSGAVDDGLDLQMDMDDTAFGDAFHGVEGSRSHSPGDGNGQDM